MTTADFAAAFAALYAAHQVADHWVQTQPQADRKGLPGWAGRIACVAHVASYTLTAVVALALVAAATGWRPNLLAVAAGLTVSAVSHYAADRRTPLRRLADLLGKDPHWLERGGGLYALDQSWHVGWLFVAALLCAV
ncbi:transcriptional regulator [Micromonospora sp. WMMD734]|uniref:transcriptional regulator n=1 Tax=Micromonospora sp. WMMD734 TaxID=3404129 RepID=UPI003B94C311